MTNDIHIAETAAAEIVEQMSSDDLVAFTRDAWRAGVSDMLQGEWEGLDLDEVLDAMEELVTDRRGAHLAAEMSVLDTYRYLVAYFERCAADGRALAADPAYSFDDMERSDLEGVAEGYHNCAMIIAERIKVAEVMGEAACMGAPPFSVVFGRLAASSDSRADKPLYAGFGAVRGWWQGLARGYRQTAYIAARYEGREASNGRSSA